MIDWVHLEHVVGEAVLAGVLAFAATYGATQNLQASLIAGVLAASTKTLPPSVIASLTAGNVVPPAPPTGVK